MNPPDESATLGELLQHDAWLRRLAVALVGQGDAEDLVQETWMAAAKQPPKGEARPWLAAVARRLAAQGRRSRIRLLRREQAAARAEALPSTEETLQALSVQREVTSTLDQLAEPYRTAVLLRYHHELSYEAVAERMGCGVPAVRQRVSRGLERMRVSLAARHGAEWRSMPGIALLCGFPDPSIAAAGTAVASTSTTTILVAAAMPKILTSVAAVALCAILGLFAFGGGGPIEGSVGPTEALAAEEAKTKSGDPIRDPEAPMAREKALPQPMDPVASAGPKSEAAVTVRGKVVDPYGKALAGVPIMLHEDLHAVPIGAETPGGPIPTSGVGTAPSLPVGERIGVSGPGGAFELSLDEDRGDLTVGGGWCSLTMCKLNGTGDRDQVVLVASKGAPVGGVVLTRPSNGGPLRPLAGAQVRPGAVRLLSLPVALDRTERHSWLGVTTDAEGRFSFPILPIQGYKLKVSCAGHESLDRPLESAAGSEVFDTDTLEIVLEQQLDPWLTLYGSVLLPNGSRATSGEVGFHNEEVKIQPDGTYEIRLERESLERTYTFYAGSPGFQCAAFDFPLERAAQGPDGRWLLDVTLPAESLVITGTVLGPEGEPWGNVLVYPWMEKGLGWQHLMEDHSQPQDQPKEWSIGQKCYALTDDEGRFTLKGLRERSYDLRFLKKEVHINKVVADVAAGRRDVIVQFGGDSLIPEVTGVVVDPTGQPQEGVKVHTSVVTWAAQNGGSMSATGTHTFTDAKGRFTLEQVPATDCKVVATHDQLIRLEMPAAASLRMVTPRRCHLQLDVGAAYPQAAKFVARDATGDALDLYTLRSMGGSWRKDESLAEGRSEVLQVSELAISIELQDADRKVITTLPLRLVPGEVTTVR